MFEKINNKIESVEPPEKVVVLQEYEAEVMTQKQAMKISMELRETYAKKLATRNYGEMENAVLSYDSARTLALVDKQIVGAISFQWDEVSKVVFISHVGTLKAPKGTGAELVRTAVETAYKGKWGMALESTYEAIPFWKRLGFVPDKKVPYVFGADFKRVTQIREALGAKKKLNRDDNMFDKQKLRIENLDQEQLNKASDRELAVFRLRFGQLWNKHFQKCDDIIVGSLNRYDLITKYRMLLKMMRKRDLEHSTEAIDREAFKRAMQIKKAGLDIAQLEPVVLCANAVFIKEDFLQDEDDEIEVIIKSDIEEPNEALEEAITEMLGGQLDRACVFIYTKDFSGSCIPLFHDVLSPVLEIEKIEMQERTDFSELGEQKFERNVPIVPLLKGKVEERIVYGIVYEPDTEDSQGDEANAEEIRKAAYQFMEECQTFKVMHKGKNVKVRILENYIAPVDFTIEGKSVKKGSWVLVTRILDNKIWKAIKKGKLTGYSMAGYARTA